MSEIEEDMLSEKPWQLTGEVSAVKRPENSLLQENLQFEHTTRLRKLYFCINEVYECMKGEIKVYSESFICPRQTE